MAFLIPAVDDFKAQFARDFPYAVPSFGASPGTPVVAGGIITGFLNPTIGRGYTTAPIVQISDPTGVGAVITAQSPQQGAIPGFTIGNGGTGYTAPVITVVNGSGNPTDPASVQDGDISGAIVDAQFNMNPGLFDTQANFNRAFLYLAAHYMVEKLLAAGEGVRSRYNWLVSGKSAGDLSESYSIPPWVLEDPYLAAISKTRYGSLYLSIVIPLSIGNMSTSFRQTPP